MLPLIMGGLSAIGGGSALAGAATVGGLGMSAYSMFSGSSQGSAPSSKVNLTDRAKKLEGVIHGVGETRWADAVTGKLNDNLVAPILANIRRTYQASNKQAEKLTSASAARTATQTEKGGMLQGGNQARAAVLKAGGAMDGQMGVEKKKQELQKEQYSKALGFGQNIMNVEKQTPMLRAQSMFGTSLQDQMISQQQGNMLGTLAQFGGMVGFNNAQNKWYKEKGY